LPHEGKGTVFKETCREVRGERYYGFLRRLRKQETEVSEKTSRD